MMNLGNDFGMDNSMTYGNSMGMEDQEGVGDEESLMKLLQLLQMIMGNKKNTGAIEGGADSLMM